MLCIEYCFVFYMYGYGFDKGGGVVDLWVVCSIWCVYLVGGVMLCGIGGLLWA